MIKITINNKPVIVEEGCIILKAAQQLNIQIPTLCFLEGCRQYTSCMLCVVKEEKSGKLLPSCSTRAENDMNISTDSDDVFQARKVALDLLLSDHVGDCEAPCRMGCPAYMDIPKMLALIESGQMHQALLIVKNHIPLPATLGRICPAPCEKVCRRGKVDHTIPICELKRMVADIDLAQKSPYIPKCQPSIGKTVGIIGAGPAGISAAYYLQIMGYQCTLYDDHAKPGGMLQYGISEENLSRDVLDSEIVILRKMGCHFEMGVQVGKDLSINKLKELHDVLIVATGKIDAELCTSMGIQFTDKGVEVDRQTLSTTVSTIFAGGSAIGSSRLAVRSIGHGRQIAHSIHDLFSNEKQKYERNRFHSRAGRLSETDLKEFVKYARSLRGLSDDEDFSFANLQEDDLASTSGYCLHCECLSAESCKLKIHSDAYGASGNQYRGAFQMPVEKDLRHPAIVYEPNKCIRCGICVRIAEANQEPLGLTFIGRGFHVKVGVPFHESLDKALEKVAIQCAEACPTGALAGRGA